MTAAGSGPFASATAVRPAAAGEWSAAIQPGWDIAGNANGGYLLALATRALVRAARRPDPVTVTAHYLSPGQPGSVRIATKILKEGKRFSTGTATMFSGSRPLVTVLGTLGDLSQAQGPELIEGAPPELPLFERVVMETPTPHNALGAKGIGESGTIGSTPAVHNAVVDALAHLGVRHLDMPATPEKVWRALPT